jgi:hypothetical protein
MKVRNFSAKNSKNNATSTKYVKEEFATDDSILRKNDFVLTSKGFSKFDNKDSTIRAINDLYDSNESLLGTVTIRRNQITYLLSFAVKQSFLTIGLILDASKMVITPLTNELVSTYPTLEKYRGKPGYSVISSNGYLVKGESSVLSWYTNVQDSTAFSKAISSANSLQFQALYIVNSGKLIEAISCRYVIA